jgi:XTP/dITP diphosphohydrolase
LGKIIWNAVGERMCDFLRPNDTRATVARATIGYCDGRRIHLYEGATAGTVAKRARGKYNTSNWDPIFIPEGEAETYGEMGRERKLKTSPLVKAWRAFIDHEFPVIQGSSPVRLQGKKEKAVRLPKPK